jgi:hypothetical protein
LSRKALSTFDIKATSASLPAGSKADELMFDWTALPDGAAASIYLPAVSADATLATAGSMYGAQPFTRIDDHTLGCAAKGIAFMPIPPGSGNYAGLLTVELPNTVQAGDKYVVVISQITNAEAGRHGSTRTWRKVVGTFQLSIPIGTKAVILPTAERNLSILRSILDSTPQTSRWYPVMLRYVGAFADGVEGLGGDPSLIPPSATGTWPGWPGEGAGKGHHKGEPGSRLIGKVAGLVYDHFGDFEGFILETDCGDSFTFYSRENHMADLARRAWAERLRITVVSEHQDEERPQRIVLHPPTHLI